ARAAGRTVVFGRCWDGSGAPPFWPWAQAVRELTGRDGELAELVGAGEGFPLYEAVVRLVNGYGRVLVVLDDLQWADASSLGLLEFLATTRACPRLTVVATYRDTDVAQPLSRHLPALVRLPHAERITLAGLSEGDIGEYLGREGADPALAGRMARLTAGNPFFLGEVVRLGEGVAAPDAVADVVMGRVAALPPHTGEVLTAAALLGREARLDVLLDVLADTAGVPQDQVLDILDAAVRARLLAERAEPPIGHRFVHDIVRDVLRAGLAPLRRRRLHAQVAAVLERRGDAPPAEIAHHYREGLVLTGTAAKAIEYSRQAAAHATGQLAHEDAVEHLGHAVRLTGEPAGGDLALRCDLLLDLAEAQAAAGMSTAVRATLDEAAALAEEMGDIDRLARAALGFSDLIYWLMFEEWAGMDRFAARIERVLRDQPGDSPWAPQLLAALAVAGYYRRSLDESAGLAMEAVRMARRSGDDRSLLRTLVAHEMLLRGDADPRERQALVDEIIEIGVRIGDLPYEWLGREADYIMRVSAGDFDRADELLTWLYETALSLRQPAMLSLAAWQKAVTAYLRGRFDEALAGAEESGLAHPEGALGRGDPDSRTQLFRSLVLRCRDRAAEALAVADGMPAGAPDDLSRRLVRCLALLDLNEAGDDPDAAGDGLSEAGDDLDAAGDDRGRRDEARAVLAELAADGFEAVEHDLYYRFIADALSEICLAVGDTAAARALYDRITVKDGLFGWSLAGLCLGRLAMVLGDTALAERHLREGLAFVTSSGARLYEAPVLALLAEVTGDAEIRGEAARAAAGRVSGAGRPGEVE
ncbi:hypothetical protein AB0B89_09800, partial [Sphaerisporangium sp. NPDC049002]|uniref:ATP-binding protein n=1 Tax=Sphaerisporangium sp. NPDC049002 TaxID=3155392 RepID=UPI0034027CFB